MWDISIMKILSIALTSLCFLVAHSVSADEEYSCQNGNLQRLISVVYENGEAPVPCSVQYDKGHGAEVLWYAQAEVGYCEAKADEFLEKQESWGWSCDKVSVADVQQAEAPTSEVLNSNVADVDTEVEVGVEELY